MASIKFNKELVARYGLETWGHENFGYEAFQKIENMITVKNGLIYWEGTNLNFQIWIKHKDCMKVTTAKKVLYEFLTKKRVGNSRLYRKDGYDMRCLSPESFELKGTSSWGKDRKPNSKKFLKDEIEIRKITRKFNPRLVRAIRHSHYMNPNLDREKMAKKYDTTRDYIGKIIRKEVWK